VQVWSTYFHKVLPGTKSLSFSLYAQYPDFRILGTGVEHILQPQSHFPVKTVVGGRPIEENPGNAILIGKKN
jgi:hypothetical protein